MRMHGQWLRRLEGENAGLVVLDLDDDGDRSSGSGFYFPDDARLPAAHAPINLPDLADTQRLTGVPLTPLTRNGIAFPRSELASRFPDTEFAETADITLAFRGPEVELQVHTAIDTRIDTFLSKSQADRPSELLPLADVAGWADFKSFVSRLPLDRFIFRGQNCTHRLRTAFHRTGRKDLVRYISHDAPLLLQTITPVTNHLFNMAEPLQVAAFYNLVQHHGYPTPLLDWTFSPFIAAFFAYRSPGPSDTVRIFMFDREAWYRLPQFASLANLPFHLSLLETIGVSNARLLPQQGISTLTNVDDVESYIRAIEATHGRRYLQVFELPASARVEALDDLRRMGIGPASLFPGLDGACEGLRARLFGYG